MNNHTVTKTVRIKKFNLKTPVNTTTYNRSFSFQIITTSLFEYIHDLRVLLNSDFVKLFIFPPNYSGFYMNYIIQQDLQFTLFIKSKYYYIRFFILLSKEKIQPTHSDDPLPSLTLPALS